MPYTPTKESATSTPESKADLVSAAQRKPSRHRLVNEKSTGSLIKAPSRERVGDTAEPPSSVTHVLLEAIAPDATMSDLDRDEMQVTFDMLQFEESETHVIATANYTDGSLGFSKGQVMEVYIFSLLFAILSYLPLSFPAFLFFLFREEVLFIA